MIPSPNTEAELLNEDKELEEDAFSNSGWFSSRKIGAMAMRLRDSIPSASAAVRQTLDGIADVIAISAASIAMEFNEMEREAREQAEKGEDEVQEGGTRLYPSNTNEAGSLKRLVEEDTKQSMENFVQCCNKAFSKLPWEVWKNEKHCEGSRGENSFLLQAYENTIHGRFVEDDDMKQRIQALSLDEKTFTEPFLDNDALVIENSMQFGGDSEYDAQYCYFEQKKRITEAQFLEENRSTITRLLDADANLLKIYQEIVGSTAVVSEGVFWKNYFFHCERLRITLENERTTQKKNLADVTLRHSGELMNNYTPEGSFRDDEFDDAVLVSKCDALTPFVQKCPQTLSNGSIVLIGNDGGDLEQYVAEHKS